MRRYTYVVIALGLIGWLGVNTPAAQGISKTEIQERVKAHINERMYDCCRSVMLTEKPDGTYEGFALLLNGIQSSIEVRVSGQDIVYTFTRLKPPAQPADRSPVNVPARNVTPADVAAAQETEAPLTAPAADLTFTSSMYTQIQKGMTYRQVADLLGAAGEQLSSSYFDGVANQVYVWANPDDSHICVVFQDGAVLIKTQSGLPGIAPLPPLQDGQTESDEFEEFRNRQLARKVDGRIVLLGLSLSQWLEDVSNTRSSEPGQVEVIEQDDELGVKLTRKDPGGAIHDTTFHLKCLPAENVESPAGVEIEGLCIPSRMTEDGKESANPALTWKAMADLAGLGEGDQKSNIENQK
jgi:hypothetical protein